MVSSLPASPEPGAPAAGSNTVLVFVLPKRKWIDESVAVADSQTAVKPRPAVIFRPELRYYYNDESRPFENHHGVFTATADMILRW